MRDAIAIIISIATINYRNSDSRNEGRASTVCTGRTNCAWSLAATIHRNLDAAAEEIAAAQHRHLTNRRKTQALDTSSRWSQNSRSTETIAVAPCCASGFVFQVTNLARHMPSGFTRLIWNLVSAEGPFHDL